MKNVRDFDAAPRQGAPNEQTSVAIQRTAFGTHKRYPIFLCSLDDPVQPVAEAIGLSHFLVVSDSVAIVLPVLWPTPKLSSQEYVGNSVAPKLLRQFLTIEVRVLT